MFEMEFEMSLAKINGALLSYSLDGPEGKFIHKRVPSSELKIIPDAAHFIHVEQATLFNAAVLEFLKSA